MSLVLRQKCQQLLDDNNLSMLHADINAHNYYMELATECGKPVTTIKGVQFSRRSPTMGEIDYAVKLLDAFLVKHRDIIYKAVNKMFRLRELEAEPPIPVYSYGHGKEDISENIYAWNNDVFCHIDSNRLLQENGFIKVRILRSGAVEVANSPIFTGTKPVSINVSSHFRKKAKEFHEWQAECNKTRMAADKYWNEAQQCEI
jgi:hypothetical protein